MPIFRILFLSLICILFIGCATSQGEKKNIADLHLRMGTSYLQQGNYPQALKELLEAVELDPKSPVIHNNLALAYFVRDKFTEAESHLKTAIDLDSKYTDARNNLGRVYISMKLYDQAIAELTPVINDLTYPTPEKAHANMAMAYYKKGEFLKARDTALLSLKSEKTFCPAQIVYGLSLFFLEDYKKAGPSLEKTVNQCDKEKEEALYYSGLSYFKIGSKAKAEARLQEMVHLYPEGEYAEKAKTMIGIIK